MMSRPLWTHHGKIESMLLVLSVCLQGVTGVTHGANRGETAFLECPFNPSYMGTTWNIMSVRWSRGKHNGFIGQRIITDDNGEKYIDNDKYKIINDSTLRISSVDYSDEDNYTCTVSFFIDQHSNARDQSSEDVTLVVCVPFSLELDISSLQPGQNMTTNNTLSVHVLSIFTVTCTALLGRPVTDIKWLINGRRLDSGPFVTIREWDIYDGELYNTTSQLHIPSIQPGQGGLYSCIGENEAATNRQTRDFFIEVDVPTGFQLPLITTATTTTASLTPPGTGQHGGSGGETYNIQRILKDNTQQIIYCVIGGITFLVIVIGIVIVVKRRRKNSHDLESTVVCSEGAHRRIDQVIGTKSATASFHRSLSTSDTVPENGLHQDNNEVDVVLFNDTDHLMNGDLRSSTVS